MDEIVLDTQELENYIKEKFTLDKQDTHLEVIKKVLELEEEYMKEKGIMTEE